jgi:exosome complex component RRP45
LILLIDRQIVISDPTDIEERISIADLAFGMNSYREICALHFGGEAVINKNTVLSLANEAASYAGDIVKMIKAEIEKDSQKRKETRGDIDGLLTIINTERVLSASQDRNSLRLPGSTITGIASGLEKGKRTHKFKIQLSFYYP